MLRICADNVMEEFDQILREVDEDMHLKDQGEAAPSAVGPPTTERQVLAALASCRGKLRGSADRVGLMPGANPCIYNKTREWSQLISFLRPCMYICQSPSS